MYFPFMWTKPWFIWLIVDLVVVCSFQGLNFGAQMYTDHIVLIAASMNELKNKS